MGHETPTTIAARRLARDDHHLDVALFGDDEVQPTFVEYQPNLRFTETDPDGYLLFTVDTAFPLIRYRINDCGSVVTAPELMRLLDQFGHKLAVRTSTEDAGFIRSADAPTLRRHSTRSRFFPRASTSPWKTARLPGSLAESSI